MAARGYGRWAPRLPPGAGPAPHAAAVTAAAAAAVAAAAEAALARVREVKAQHTAVALAPLRAAARAAAAARDGLDWAVAAGLKAANAAACPMLLLPDATMALVLSFLDARALGRVACASVRFVEEVGVAPGRKSPFFGC